MRTLTALLTLLVNAFAAGTPQAGTPLVVSEATLEGVVFLIALGGILGIIKIVITGKRMR